MKWSKYLLGVAATFFLSFSHAEIQPDNPFPRVKMVTSMGDIVVELNRDAAPLTVKNFFRYVKKAQYNGTIFHRLVPGFVIQGGGYDKNFQDKPSYEKIVNESGNGLKNEYGTIAMAREREPHSGTRQFFFNLNDNTSLNPDDGDWGYAVFGRIVEGVEVLEAMAELESQAYSDDIGWADVPVDPPTLKRIEVVPQN
ncbi:peptidylprolyl isomerase [Idiomarina abyssalis]|jgi:peptidyl-prolyl cis-trans isomerase A (cyclophilin A)|uniref:peptidylprolyl isomerase n=1 Tax=Idiomarina TaxID=135575 RepID=UPI000C5C719F|nr:peptidylprolyl isomerase [Idiomarina abyssalis]MBE91383.1 peptidylprolyl isomerase [Idiomarina sp.]MDA6065536.1 peptidylprolyl isomerase [Idiomarina abyssalis]QZN90263.1 peptidylprolyl isomerase [Idiomarina abyssalis]